MFSETACQASEVTLRCPGQGKIRLVRAVWGRYSLAICNSGRNNFLDMLSSTTCGDTVTPLQVIKGRCQGENHCKVLADSSVFGDPCPGVEEFLEVQFKCMENPKKEMVRRPKFSDNQIADLWADDQNIKIDQRMFERLSLVSQADSRIPVTEASVAEALGRRGEENREVDGERSIVVIVATVCLLMLPIILLLTVMILRTNSGKKSSCRIQHSQLSCPSKPNMIFCRLEAERANMTRKFSSEPSLVAHNCLIDSSTSLFRFH